LEIFWGCLVLLLETSTAPTRWPCSGLSGNCIVQVSCMLLRSHFPHPPHMLSAGLFVQPAVSSLSSLQSSRSIRGADLFNHLVPFRTVFSDHESTAFHPPPTPPPCARPPGTAMSKENMHSSPHCCGAVTHKIRYHPRFFVFLKTPPTLCRARSRPCPFFPFFFVYCPFVLIRVRAESENLLFFFSSLAFPQMPFV